MPEAMAWPPLRDCGKKRQGENDLYAGGARAPADAPAQAVTREGASGAHGLAALASETTTPAATSADRRLWNQWQVKQCPWPLSPAEGVSPGVPGSLPGRLASH